MKRLEMRHKTRILALLLLLLSVVGGVHAQLSAHHAERKSLLGIEVHFRFDKSQLDLNYMNNAQSLDRFDLVVDSIGLDKIDSVVIVSQSSPEGVYEHNLNLSRRRAATMRKTIEQRRPDLVSCLHVHPDGEAWARLRDYVVKDTKMKDETIERVLRVIDADINVGTKKWRLQQLPIYRYLLQTYYPRLRNSVFCIVYFTDELPADTLPEVKEEVVEEIPVEEPVEEPIEESVEEVVSEPEPVYEPMLNVHTNLFYDLATGVNLGIEYYPHNSRWSVAANYTFPWWGGDKHHRYLQLLDGELEVRRYFDKEAGHSEHYLMGYGHANLYDLSFDAERAWQGEGWGIGFGYGYVWQPWKNKRWKIEAFLRIGYYHSLYDPYHASDPYNGKYYYDWEGAIEDFERRNHRLRWIGPTGIGVTLSYDLLTRKITTSN